MSEPSVIILVADGLGPAALKAAIGAGEVPALAALGEDGSLATITTAFPSVTGVAYVPMLTGRHPGRVGVPGLRWYDRSRAISRWLGHSRSYVGVQLRRMDADLSPLAATAFQLLPGSLGSMSVPARGLARGRRLDRGAWFSARAIASHVAGDVEAWGRLERSLADRFVDRVHRQRPRFAFAAFTAGDKASHAAGPASEGARQSLRLVDEVAGRIRADAERAGRWRSLHFWIVSDHGHSPVHRHLDLADACRDAGLRVRSHPWTIPDRSEVAVMVSGNCMAHVYADLAPRRRIPWPSLAGRWQGRLQSVLEHPAVDLVATMTGDGTVEVRRPAHGSALITVRAGRYGYVPRDGNPLGIEPFDGLDAAGAWERSDGTAYPDGVVQLAQLVLGERSGDLVLSATPGWDFRRRYETLAHVSSHGGLHRAHMEVPLLLSKRPAAVPRRTADLFPSLLRVVGVPEPQVLDGTSFLH